VTPGESNATRVLDEHRAAEKAGDGVKDSPENAVMAPLADEPSLSTREDGEVEGEGQGQEAEKSDESAEDGEREEAVEPDRAG
jgi:hypothetical protein